MVFGEEIHFFIQDPASGQSLSDLFLRFLGIDQVGMKMKGIFARLWSKRRNKIIGPHLTDEEHTYRVIAFDYDLGKLWLMILV